MFYGLFVIDDPADNGEFIALEILGAEPENTPENIKELVDLANTTEYPFVFLDMYGYVTEEGKTIWWEEPEDG